MALVYYIDTRIYYTYTSDKMDLPLNWNPCVRGRGRGWSQLLSSETERAGTGAMYDDTKYAIGGEKPTKRKNRIADERELHQQQYHMTGDARDRYEDVENMPDDQWIEYMQNDDPYRFVTQRTKTNKIRYDNSLDCKPLDASDADDSVTRQKTVQGIDDRRPRSFTHGGTKAIKY